MSRGLLDDVEFDLPCPSCGRATKRTMRWVTTNNGRAHDCRWCGTSVTVDSSQAAREVAKVNRAFDDLQRQLKRLGR